MCTGWRACLRLILVGAAIVLSSWTGISLAQPLAGDRVFAASAEELPLSSVLMAFARETGTDLLYDPALVADISVRLAHSAGSIEERLSEILRDTPLTFARLDSGTYVLVSRQASTPQSGGIHGRVFDAVGRRPIPSAHVILAGTGSATATDREGAFSFTSLDPGSYRVIISHIGYGARLDSVRVVRGLQSHAEFELEPVEIAVSPLIVEDSRGVDRVHRHDRTWTSGRLESTPAGLSPDVVRSLNHLMGVRVGDALADVHVQGGEAGEHQFRLDGVPVFEPVHLRGLLGAFNPFAIGRVTVHKAGFGAEHGSHLAGVISAEHALTSQDGHAFDLQIDPLSMNARLHGTARLARDVRMRFMTAARTSLWSLYPEQLYPPLKNLLREWNTPDMFLPQAWFFAFEQQVDPEIAQWFEEMMDSLDVDYTAATDPELGFGDFHFAADLHFGDRHLVYGSIYRGWNNLNGNRLSLPFLEAGEDPPVSDPRRSTTTRAHRDDYNWLNATMQVQHDALLSDRSFLRTRLRSSEYSLNHTYNALAQGSVQVLPLPDGWVAVRMLEDIRPTDNGNGIREVALESSLDHSVSHRLSLGAGVDVINTDYRFAIEDVSDYRPLSDSSSTWRYAAFAHSRIALTDRIETTIGSRLTYLPHRAAAYVEPRAELRYLAPYSRFGPWSAWTAGGIYRQYVNQFNVSSVSPSVLLPAIRFWLPTDETVTPPKAIHMAGGFMIGPFRTWSFRTEAYYKHQPHILTLDYVNLWDQRRDEVHSDEGGQRRFLRAGRGYGYGGAIALSRETLKTRALLRYEFSHARRTRTLLPAEERGELPPVADAPRASGFEPVPWNEPHQMEAAFDWSVNDAFVVTARWRSYWGRAWAFRQSYYDYLATDPLLSPSFGTGGYDLRRPEDHRLPAFHQLDVAAAYSLPVGATVCQIRIDLLNALNRANEADWTLQPDESDEGETSYRVVARTMLPRTPSVTLRLRW